jgi:hypothetical protein
MTPLEKLALIEESLDQGNWMDSWGVMGTAIDAILISALPTIDAGGEGSLLEGLLEAQAKLEWRRKGSPPNQSSDAMADDMMSAKRHFGCVIAHQLLGEKEKGCLLDILCDSTDHERLIPTLAEYLARVSVHEFARHAAYHIWAMNRVERIGTPSQHADDYRMASGAIREDIVKCSCSCDRSCCRSKCQSLLKGYVAQYPHPALCNAKMNALRRLHITGEVVSSVQAHYTKDYHGTWSNPEEMWKHLAAVNMLEVLLHCWAFAPLANSEES